MLKALATAAVQNIKKDPTPAFLAIGYPTFFSVIIAGSLKVKETDSKHNHLESTKGSLPRGHF